MGLIPNEPEVVRPVPSPPEAMARVVVGHATDHILRRVNAVHEGPKAEEPPREEELFRSKTSTNHFAHRQGKRGANLEPDDDEVPETDGQELARAKVAKCHLDVLKGHDVDELEKDLHCEKREEEPEAIANERLARDRGRTQNLGKRQTIHGVKRRMKHFFKGRRTWWWKLLKERIGPAT